jgi:hypothetical protein
MLKKIFNRIRAMLKAIIWLINKIVNPTNSFIIKVNKDEENKNDK